MSAWPDVTLGEIFDVSSSKRVLQSDWKTSGVPFYRAREIVKLARDGFVDNELFISEELYVDLAQKYGASRAGDIMVSAVGTLGACYVVQPNDRFYFKDASVLRFRAKREICPQFFSHAFRTNYVLDQVHAGSGSTVGTYTIERANSTRLRVPPLQEQRRIAAILDQAETLRTQRRQALAHLDTLTQSLFLDMFGDGNTPEPTIGELLQKKVLLLHKDGNHGSLYPRAEEFGDEGVPFLSARCVSDGGEIQEQFIDRLQDQKANQLRIGWIEKGDVLLAHNASVGKVAFYDGRYPKALIGTSLTAFRADQSILSPAFLAAAFRSTKFQAQLFKNMGQTTRNQVPITAQRELKVALPPIALQQTFATRIQAIESLKATHRTALAQLDALFASLQQRAFAGEL